MAADPGHPGVAPRVVVLIGSESTGKSTLAARLAERFDVPCSLEYARLYVDQVQRRLHHHDIVSIAEGQLTLEDDAWGRAAQAGRPLVIKDTDLVSTVVYARHYHGHCPPFIERQARDRLGDLYLLLAADVPWVADGLQRQPGRDRQQLQGHFEALLRQWEAVAVTIDGEWTAREEASIAAIEALLTPRPGTPG